jgi:hypothetical protein
MPAMCNAYAVSEMTSNKKTVVSLCFLCIATGISLISQSSPKIWLTSGLWVTILVSGCWMTSGSVDSMASESGVASDVGFFTRIFLSVCVFLEMQLKLLQRSKMTAWSF